MIDIYRLVPPLVGDIAELQPNFPDIAERFPVAVLTPIDRGEGTVINGEERLALAVFQIDIFDTNRERCGITAQKTAARLTKYGFSRGSGFTSQEGGITRRMMEFSARIDEHTGMVYRR